MKDESVSCRMCGKPMVIRRRKSDGHEFYGCQGFPVCRATRSLEEVEEERIGDYDINSIDIDMRWDGQ